MLTKTSMDLLSVGHEGEVSTVLVLFLCLKASEGNLRFGTFSSQVLHTALELSLSHTVKYAHMGLRK